MSNTQNDFATALRLRLRFEAGMGIQYVIPIQAATQTTIPPPPVDASVFETTNFDSTVPDLPTSPTTLSLEERWAHIEERAKNCQRCNLCLTRNKVVVGDGNRKAKLVFVGEGPGAEEDRIGRPFVGAAGQLLDKIIASMKLQREEVYICNVVKCRPPGNRTPSAEETLACWPFLNEQLELISPKAIVALGAPAARTILNTESGITSLRGRWGSYNGIKVMPTFHPAYLLRLYKPDADPQKRDEARRQVFEDMQQVLTYLRTS